MMIAASMDSRKRSETHAKHLHLNANISIKLKFKLKYENGLSPAQTSNFPWQNALTSLLARAYDEHILFFENFFLLTSQFQEHVRVVKVHKYCMIIFVRRLPPKQLKTAGIVQDITRIPK